MKCAHKTEDYQPQCMISERVIRKGDGFVVIESMCAVCNHCEERTEEADTELDEGE